MELNNELIDNFKKAVYANIEFWAYEKMHENTPEDEYEEFVQEKTTSYYIGEFIKIVDNGDEILAFKLSPSQKSMYIDAGVTPPSIEFYDFLDNVFDEVFEKIKNSENVDELILEEAKKYLDFCIYVKEEIPKLQDNQSFYIRDMKIVTGEIREFSKGSEIKEDFIISEYSGIPGALCCCGSTYTEYMADDMWHCGECDNYFEN